jgi:hypothetical protein
MDADSPATRWQAAVSPPGHKYQDVHIDKGARAQLGDTYRFGGLMLETVVKAER